MRHLALALLVVCASPAYAEPMKVKPISPQEEPLRASNESIWKPLIDKSDAVALAHCHGLPEKAKADTPVKCTIKQLFKGKLDKEITVVQRYDGQLRLSYDTFLFLKGDKSPYTLKDSTSISERNTKFGKEMRVYDPSGVGSEVYINDKGESVQDGMSHDLDSVIRDLTILSKTSKR